MTFVHLFETCNQDSSAVLAILNDVFRRLKDVMPHLQSIYLRQDNAGYYHCALTLVNHPFEFRLRYRVGISNAEGNRIIWRCPWSKSSVVQTSFVFHQKASEMGCCELCQQRSEWRGRCESMEIRLQNWRRQIHSLKQVPCSWPGRSSNTWMQCSKRKHKS